MACPCLRPLVFYRQWHHAKAHQGQPPSDQSVLSTGSVQMKMRRKGRLRKNGGFFSRKSPEWTWRRIAISHKQIPCLQDWPLALPFSSLADINFCLPDHDDNPFESADTSSISQTHLALPTDHCGMVSPVCTRKEVEYDRPFFDQKSGIQRKPLGKRLTTNLNVRLYREL